MTSYFSQGGPLQGDLPWEEARRGGSRDWTAETDSLIHRQYERNSLTNSDRVDDFTALKNEALKQMKARKRSRAAVLPVEGGVAVHDVKHLKDQKVKHRIMEQIMEKPADGTGTDDDLVIARRCRDRLSAVGLSPPTILVRYQNITVSGKVIVASKALPSLAASVSSRLPKSKKHGADGGGTAPRQRHVILDSVSGVLRPGRFTLLLGPPKSGKPTLLRSLAGLVQKTPGLTFSCNELTFNGFSFDQFVPERSAAYISQMDLHYGELTVRETLDFSARCQGFLHRSMIEELHAREEKSKIHPDPALDAFVKSWSFGGKHSLITELILRILGLEHAANTVVGNEMLRGISGGQKKRLTTGEIIVGPARALFADEISTGLDSATIMSVIKALRDACHILDATTLVGLLQPPPETYALFDDVILLSAGKVVYHGPREAVLPFFEGLGLTLPPRSNVSEADFLQEVTLMTQQQKFWSDESRAYRYITPATMQREFHETDTWRATEKELSRPLELPPHADSTAALSMKKYGAPAKELLRAVASRAWILQKRTKMFAIIRTAQVALMALVLASLFWREDKNTVDDGNFFLGVLFYSLLYQLLGGISEMHVLTARLPVFHKQRSLRYYPGWTFAVAVALLRVPYSFLEATIWTNIVYWLVGFNASTRFLMFWAIMSLINLWSVMLFQLVAAVCRDDTIATAVGSFFLLIFINISGFVINASSVPAWWLEGLWANPFYYAMKALAINEFTSSSWDRPNPASSSVGGSVLGLDILSYRGFPTEYWWCWVCIGFIIVTGILNFLLLIVALTFLGPFKQRVVLPPEILQESEAARRLNSTFSSPKKETHAHAPLPGTEINVVAGAEPVTQPIPTYPPPSSPPQSPSSPSPSSSSLSSPFSPPPPLSPPPQQLSSVIPVSDRLSFTSQAASEYRQKTALPFTPVVLTFRHVAYSVPLSVKDTKEEEQGRSPDEVERPSSGPHAGQLRLLHDINGVFRPFVLTALMGASGAGKTTLLDVLADRKTEGKITGDVRVNGNPKDSTTFAMYSAYVEQTDVHLPQTSVREALAFSAALRLPTTVDASTRERFVDEILELLELDRIAHAFVGVPGVSGLNVEQRKRLTLAVELVSNPSIIFCDEPTSGLDSRAATVVMRAIRNTVNSGRTVVCTIHQPSIDIFEAFDELLLLKAGGRTVYFGALGDGAAFLIEYLQRFSGVRPLPPRYNPANWMLEEISAVKEEAAKIDFADAYAASDLCRSMDDVIRQYETPEPGASPPLVMHELHVASFSVQFLVNFHRFWKMYWRSPEYNLTRLAVTLGIAFVFGSLFWRQGDNTSDVVGVLNIAGALFSSVLFVGITDCLMVQHTTALIRNVSYRERAAGYYGVFPFALAQLVVELPYLAVQTVLFSSIVYWMVWFARDAGKFFLFNLFFFLTLVYFVFFGQACMALAPSVPLANVLSSFFFGFWNLFCGFLIPQIAMPVYYKFWIYWLDPVSWSLYGLSISQLGDLNDVYIQDFNGQMMTVPDFLAARFNWHRYMMWPIVPILLAFAGAFGFVFFIALKKINYQRR